MLGNRRLNSRGRARLIVVIVVAAVLFAGGVYAVWFSPLFVVRSVEVEGAVSTDISVFNEAVGDSIIFWKLPVSADDLPYVSAMEVRKDFIGRRILVNLTERNRDIIWCMEKSSKCFWADENGLIFSSAPMPSGTLVVKVVRDYTERELGAGDTVLPDDLFGNLKLIFDLMDSSGVTLSEMRIDDLKFKEITASIVGGPDVYFSLLINPAFGRSVIDSLKSSNEWQRIRYIDLRVENRAYYSL